MKTSFIKNFIKGVKIGFDKHSPEILIGLGIASAITSTVLAVKATPKAMRLIEKEQKKHNREVSKTMTGNEDGKVFGCKLKPVDIVRVTWKCYIPAAISGTASVAFLLGSNSVHARRNAAIATAYKLSETALTDNKKEVIETIGEEKAKLIQDKVAQKHVDEHPVSNNQVIITGSGKQLCYDGISGRYFESDIQTIRAAVNTINETMVYEMYASLGDFYNEIGLPPTTLSDELGWNLDDGQLEISYGSAISDDGRPCITLDYHVAPRYDFSKLG